MSGFRYFDFQMQRLIPDLNAKLFSLQHGRSLGFFDGVTFQKQDDRPHNELQSEDLLVLAQLCHQM